VAALYLKAQLHGARVQAIETQLRAMGETPLSKYETASAPSQKSKRFLAI